MSSRKAKKDDQEERNGIWNGPDEDSPIKPTAAGVPPHQTKGAHTMSMNEIEAKCKDLRQIQNLIEEAQQEAEAIKDAIKAHMGDSEELRAGEYRVTWKPVTSSRLDSKALKAALPEVVERFTMTTTCRRFCVA